MVRLMRPIYSVPRQSARLTHRAIVDSPLARAPSLVLSPYTPAQGIHVLKRKIKKGEELLITYGHNYSFS